MNLAEGVGKMVEGSWGSVRRFIDRKTYFKRCWLHSEILNPWH
jgi:hypothetical protein